MLVMIIPHMESMRNGQAMQFVSGFRIVVIRIMPQPPSFSSTAASTIEPAIGASTWAFGSQRWSPYRGIFTMKAMMHANHIKMFDQELDNGWDQ